MNITLKRTDEQVELVKAMASRNRDVAYQAQAALAEFMSPVLAEVVNQAPTLSNLFSSFSFNADSNPSLPLDLYYDINADDYIKVYSTTVPGGLPTNQVLPTASEMKFTTYRLDSAISFDRRYAAQSRLDVVGKSFTRIAQEVLLKQESTSANLVLGSLADAETNQKSHVKTQADSSIGFTLADFNSLITLAKRINTAWTGGTPEGAIKGITDLLVSPETMEDLRAMAYNPVNTKSSANDADYADSIAAPESYRSSVFTNGGVPELYGIGLMELNELGPNRKFCRLFDTFMNSSSVTGNAALFSGGDDLVIGIDRSRESLIRAVATDAESGAEFSLSADDQYSVRQQKIGYYGSLEEGRMVIDNRVLTGIVVSGH
tara:strand:- start:8303 stop:9427 length:1125 start_codon:yes stop_codon:yes gene_type:complete